MEMTVSYIKDLQDFSMHYHFVGNLASITFARDSHNASSVGVRNDQTINMPIWPQILKSLPTNEL